MKIMKKISALLLALCLAVPCFSMAVSAVDGKISFSDPETKVGDMVEVKCAVRSSGSALGNVEVKLSYDSEALSFKSGDGVEKDEAGSLTCTADGGSSEQIFLMKFQALKEGDTQITISDASVSSDAGAALSFDYGNSTVKIGEGDPSKIEEEEDGDGSGKAASDMEVDVDGVTYTLTDKFSDGDIPNGYQRTEVELEGQTRQMVVNENSEVTLAYLVGSDSSDFFIYNTEDATFSPYEELSISDTTSIVLLSDTSQVDLPESYQEAEYTIDEKTFPVWNDGSDDESYILYAINSNTGETGYYKYDTVENTYQRFQPDTSAEDEKETGGLLGKIQTFIEDNIQKIVLFGGLGLILIVLIIVILGIKLHNRNTELDELYDEYGIDEEEENAPQEEKEKKEKKGPRFGFGRKKDEDENDFEDDDFDDDFATEDMGFTGEMGFTEDMGFVDDDFEDDDFATEDMGFTEELDFATEDMSLMEEDFATEDMGFADDDFEDDLEEDFDTEDMGFVDEEDFETAHLDYNDDGLLDDVDTDEFVVYGGESRTEELTIDDLDDLLGDKPKKAAEDETGTFKMDFVDLD